MTVSDSIIPVESVSIAKGNYTVEAGATLSAPLTVTVLPADATNKSVIWSSSNENVATVGQDGLVTALAELNEPRYMTPGGIFDAYKEEITVWGRADLKDVEDSNLGLKGSPTQIAKASDKVRKGAGEKVTLDPTESVDYIVEKLKAKHII